MSAPGQTRRYDVHEPVSLIDLAPTVLERVGAGPLSHFEGRSLWPLVEGAGPAEPQPVVSELIRPQIFRRSPHQRAVVIGSSKLIVDVDGSRHYFDRAADPAERGTPPLSDSERGALDAAFESFVARLDPRPDAEVVPLEDDTRAELRALGYLE